MLRTTESSSTKPSTISLDPYVGLGDDVWLLGDSLATGIRSTLDSLSERDGIDFSNTARVGASTLWGSIQAQNPSAVGHTVWLVCLGANDAAMRVPNANFGKWVTTIRDSAIASGAHIVWLVPPNGGGLPGYSDVYKIVMDIVPDVILPPSGMTFADDGIHLTPDSYRKWAEHVWETATSMRDVATT